MRTYWQWGMAGAAGALAAVYLSSSTERTNEPTDERPSTVSGLRRKQVPVAPSRRLVRKPVAVTEPMSADYNSVELALLTKMSKLDVFEAEPRNEEWALEFETTLNSYVSETIEDLFPKVSVNTECRTASCKVSYGIEEIEGPEREMFQEYVQLFVPLGATMGLESSVSDDGDAIYTATGLLLPEMLDRDSFLEFTQKIRSFDAEKEENARRMIRALREKKEDES